MSLTDRWVYFQNVYNLGDSQINWLKNLLHIETGGMIILLTLNLFPEYKDAVLSAIPYALAGLLFSIFVFGLLLERKFHLIHSQTRFSNVRNPELQEILERLRRIEAKLK